MLIRRKFALVVLMVVAVASVIVACEPLAPEPNSQAVNGQAVIVITNTPSPAPLSPSPVLATPLPTRFVPTDTPIPGPTLTPTVPSCDETEGRLVDSAFRSEITDELIDYRLYFPPCYYLSFWRYPYVILLHGSSFDYTQWTDEIGIHTIMDDADAVGTIAPMVLIMVEGGQPQELNVFEDGESFEDIILYELIPELENTYCLWTAPEGRAIGGISRGGFWAFSITLRHPDLFAAVGGHSPFFVDDNAPPSHNPLNLATIIRPGMGLRVYLDHARSDSGATNTGRLANLLRENNVDVTYEVSATGGHDNDYWASKARDYLEFYSESWPIDRADLPTCF